MTAELRTTARTVSLSDAVFAIAITLLVLTIRVPTAEELERGGLGAAFAEAWPFVLAYLAAFVTIGVTWLGHRKAFEVVGWVDFPLECWNLLILLAVSIMPLPTAFYAAALSADPFGTPARVAAVVFVITSAVRQTVWVMFWRHVRRHPELLRDGADPDAARADQRRSGVGAVVDLVSAAVTFAVPVAATVLIAALAVVFARGARRRAGSPRAEASEAREEGS